MKYLLIIHHNSLFYVNYEYAKYIVIYRNQEIINRIQFHDLKI